MDPASHDDEVKNHTLTNRLGGNHTACYRSPCSADLFRRGLFGRAGSFATSASRWTDSRSAGTAPDSSGSTASDAVLASFESGASHAGISTSRFELDCDSSYFRARIQRAFRAGR